MSKETISMKEAVARAMCADGGFDPDERMANDGPRWQYYIPGASAAIKAMREPNSLMLRDAVENTGPVGCCC